MPEPRPYQVHHGEYTVSTDPGRLDLAVVHGFIRTAYWATGRPLEAVRRSIEHSLPFGLYRGDEQVGFGRVITDYAFLAHLADVFVLPGHRGRGLGLWLVESILRHPDLQGVGGWTLNTADAHELYRRFGFRPVDPDRAMRASIESVRESLSRKGR